MISYMIINCTNGKKYIGISTETLTERWKRHLSHAEERSDCLIHKAIRKHGVESFVITQIASYDSADTMKEAEKALIKEHKTFIGDHPSNGYNMTRGGDGC